MYFLQKANRLSRIAFVSIGFLPGNPIFLFKLCRIIVADTLSVSGARLDLIYADDTNGLRVNSLRIACKIRVVTLFGAPVAFLGDVDPLDRYKLMIFVTEL